MSSCRTILCGFAFVLFLLTPVRGGVITEIGPFVGELTEDWESFPDPPTEAPLILPSPTAIMGGAAMVSAPFMQIYVYNPDFTPGTFPHFFSLGTSGPAQVADGSQGMGFNALPGTATLVFEEPVRRFGSFWGAVTSSNPTFGTDPAIVEMNFYDELGVLVGTQFFSYTRSMVLGYTADGMLEWHGWRFTSPIKAITYTGDGVVVDGMQADLIPEPTTLVLLFLGLVFSIRRSRDRSQGN